MTLPIGHFAFGAMVTALFLIASGYHRRIGRDIFVSVLGGVWALVPDMSAVIPELRVLHETIVSNIFMFHGILDYYQGPAVAFDIVLSMVFVVGMVVSFLLIVVIEHDSIGGVWHLTPDT